MAFYIQKALLNVAFLVKSCTFTLRPLKFAYLRRDLYRRVENGSLALILIPDVIKSQELC